MAGRALRLLLCLAVASVVVLAFAGARADADEPEVMYWAQNYCWQTGQFGAEAEKCEAVWEPGYLASHTIDDDAGEAQNLRQSQQGPYCSYKGIRTPLHSEETPVFGTPSPPGSYQMGDGDGNVCAAWWAPPEDPVRWGFQLQDPSEPEAECDQIEPFERCSIERYLALATEAEINARSAKDYPWASYLGSPSLDVESGAYDEVLAFHPGLHGTGWGYRCPVLEDRTSGNIVELCLEEWRGFGATCIPYTWPCEESHWQFDRAAECRSGPSGFEHSYDRVILGREATDTLDSAWGEPLEESAYPVRTRIEAGIDREEMKAVAELDNKPYKEAPGHYGTPELGYGCGRGTSDPSSTNPAEWALIGVASGIEEWETEQKQEGLLKTQLGEGFVSTSFSPLPVEITNESVGAVGETEATVSAEINPYGSDTDYYVVYESANGKYKSPVVSAGNGVHPVPVKVYLTTLSPHTKYYYELVAYRAKGSVDGYAEYDGEYSTFDTEPFQCMGADIKGLGAYLQAPAQELWAGAFNTSTYKLACSGSQGSGGKPRVEYSASGADAGSGACLADFGADGGQRRYGEYPFCGTEEAPNVEELAEIESYRHGGEAESVETIPVGQESIVVVVHLPKDCLATSTPEDEKGKVEDLGRLALDQEVIEAIYQGTIKTWAQALALEGSDGNDQLTCSEGGENDSIRPVVPAERSGSTHIFKEFLGQVHAGAWEAEAFHSVNGGAPCSGGQGEDLEAGAAESWRDVAEGCESQRWPEAAEVLRASEVADTVNATESSIGFAGLAVAQQRQFFNPQGGGGERKKGESSKEFWAVVQDTEPGTTPVEFADPSTKSDREKEGEANCKDTVYYIPHEVFPPESTLKDWSQVKAENVSGTYPICGITYDLALAEYKPYLIGLLSAGAGSELAMTTQNYLAFVVSSAGGQALKDHDYAALTKNVEREAEIGTAEIGYSQRCEVVPKCRY